MGKIEKMFVIKNLSKCPLSVKRLVKGLIEEIANLQTKISRLYGEKEYYRKKCMALRKELLKKHHFIKLQKLLIKIQKEKAPQLN